MVQLWMVQLLMENLKKSKWLVFRSLYGFFNLCDVLLVTFCRSGCFLLRRIGELFQVSLNSIFGWEHPECFHGLKTPGFPGGKIHRELLWAVGGGRWEMFTVEHLFFLWESWNVSNDSFAILYPFFAVVEWNSFIQYVHTTGPDTPHLDQYVYLYYWIRRYIRCHILVFPCNAKTSIYMFPRFPCFAEHVDVFLKKSLGPKKIFELSDRVTLLFSFTISERRIQRLQEKIPLVHKPGGLLGLVDGFFRGVVTWWGDRKKNPGGTLIF